MRLQVITDTRPVPSPGMNTMVTILCEQGESLFLSLPAAPSCKKKAKRMYSYLIRRQQYRTQTGSIHPAFVEQRTQYHCFRRLQPGDQVVSAGIHHIKDGETVNPLPAASDTNIGGLL